MTEHAGPSSHDRDGVHRVSRRWVVLGVVAVVVVGGGAYVSRRLADGGRVTEVGVESAVERFRDQLISAPPDTPSSAATAVTAVTAVTAAATTTAAAVATTVAGTSVSAAPSTPAAPPAPALPPLGVYAYATAGHDSVDVLTGARHEYPATTTITIVPRGCGVQIRWDVAVERWDSWDWCLDGSGVRVVGWTSFHQFFGVAGHKEYLCTGDPRPLDAEPGATWEMVCRGGDSDTSTFRGTVVERTSLVVGGVEVPATHVRYDVAVVGESSGSQTIEDWYRTTDGLLLREVLSTSTQQDTAVGSTSFEEQATIDLISLTPAS